MHPTSDEIAIAFRAAAYVQKKMGYTDEKMISFIENASSISNQDRISSSVWAKHRKNPPKRIEKIGFWNALIKFLENNNIHIDHPPAFIFGDFFCDFFDAKPGSRSAPMLGKLDEEYLYFQKSSWYPGFIQTSHFKMGEFDKNKSFISIEEHQTTGKFVTEKFGLAQTNEYFDGIIFARQNIFFFIMRERQFRIPKFGIITKPLETDDSRKYSIMYGHVLKGSRSEHARFHRTPIVLKKIEDRSKDINMGAISLEKCQEEYPDEYKFFNELEKY